MPTFTARFLHPFCLTAVVLILVSSCDVGDMQPISAEGSDGMGEKLYAINLKIRRAYTRDPYAALKLSLRAKHFASTHGLSREEAMFDRTITDIYRDVDRLDSSRLYCDSALMIARELGDREAIIESYLQRAILHYENIEQDSALAYYDRAFEMIEPTKDSLLLAKLYANRANVYSRAGNYAESIRGYLDAATLFDAMGMHGPLATIYDNIAGDKSSFEEHEEAIGYYHRAIALNLENGNLMQLATDYANLGVAYKELNELDSARSSYLLSLFLAEDLDLKLLQAQNYHNLANVYIRENNLVLAEDMFSRSMQISQDMGIRYGVLVNTIGIANIRCAQNRYRQAEELYLRVLPAFEEQGVQEELMEIYSGLEKVEEGKKNYASALEFARRSLALHDSLYNEKTHQQRQQLQHRYETQQKENENIQLRNELQIRELTITRQRILVVAFLVVVILSLSLLLVQYLSRKRRNHALHLLEKQNEVIEQKSEQLIESNAIKELLLDIITHDLSNPAGTIRNTAGLLAEDEPDNELHDIILRSSGRLIDIIENARTLSQATVYETIPKEDLRVIDLISTARDEYARQIERMGVELEIRVDPDMTAHVNPVIIEVLKNYLSNAIKYAARGGRIIIEARRDDEGVEIRVIDFGDTIPEEDRTIIFKRSVQRAHAAQTGHGLGLAIAERIARAHGGTVWAEANTPTGNRFVLRLPH